MPGGSKMTEEQLAVWTKAALIMYTHCHPRVQWHRNTTSEQLNDLTGDRIDRDASELLKIRAKITLCSPFTSDPVLRNIVNGIVATDDVNVLDYASVGQYIIVRMIGQPVFSFFIKRKNKSTILGTSSAVKVAPESTIDFSLLFQRFLVMSRNLDLSLEMLWHIHWVHTRHPF